MRRLMRSAALIGLAAASPLLGAVPARGDGGCVPIIVTAYSREPFGGVTATGRSVWHGDWAATHEWAPYPYGTRFTLPDGRRFELQDVGDPYGLVPDEWVDVLVDSQAEARAWGVRRVCVGVEA